MLGWFMVVGLTASAWPAETSESTSISPLESTGDRPAWLRLAALPALGLIVAGGSYLAWDVSGDTDVDLDDPRRFETLTRVLTGTEYADVPNEEFPAERIDGLATDFCAQVDEDGDILAALSTTIADVATDRAPRRDDFFFVGALAAYAVANHCNEHTELLQEAAEANS